MSLVSRTSTTNRLSRARRMASVVAAAVLAVPLAACGSDTAPLPDGGSDAPGGSSSVGIAGLPAPMPELELPGFADAESLDLSEITEPTLINVWATWCTPCRTEMPVLEEFNQKHGDAVKVLGINYQDPQEKAAVAFARKAGVTYPSLRDVDGEINRLAPFPLLRGLPFMAMVVDGEMVGAKFSAVNDLAEVEELVENLMPGALDGSAEDAG